MGMTYQKTTGDYLVAAFPTAKDKRYNYGCVVQNYFNTEKIEVLALKLCYSENTIFKTIEENISVISSSQF